MKSAYIFFTIEAIAVFAKHFVPSETLTIAPSTIDARYLDVQPTSPPSLELVRRKLEKRQSFSSGELYVFTTSASTCGYVDGVLGNPITCPDGDYCAALAPGNGGAGACCNEVAVECNFQTDCVYYTDASSYTSFETDVLYCTDPTYTACNQYTFPELAATFWECEDTEISTKITVFTAYNEEQNAQTWEPLYWTDTASSDSSSKRLTSPAPSPSSTIPHPGHTNPPQPKPVKKPIGAIVGGVIGGFAVIGALTLGLFFLCFRKRRADHSSVTNGSSEAVYTGSAQAQTGYFAAHSEENKRTSVQPPMSSVPAKGHDTVTTTQALSPGPS